MDSSIASWFLTRAQLGMGRLFHFLYNLVIRRYRAFKTESSLGKDPFLVTFLKLEFTASMAFVVL